MKRIGEIVQAAACCSQAETHMLMAAIYTTGTDFLTLCFRNRGYSDTQDTLRQAAHTILDALFDDLKDQLDNATAQPQGTA